jgi:hypothetical protein
MDGAIESNDFSRFLSAYAVGSLGLKKNKSMRLSLNSKGGSVSEALKIGRFVRSARLRTHIKINDVVVCYSSCFLILISGVERSAASTRDETRVGIHRPYFDKETYLNSDSSQIGERYQSLIDDIKSYFQEMEVSDILLSRMLNSASDQIDLLSVEDFNKYVGRNDPMFHEWLKGRCHKFPAPTDSEMADLRRVWVIEIPVNLGITTKEYMAKLMPEDFAEYSRYLKAIRNI